MPNYTCLTYTGCAPKIQCQNNQGAPNSGNINMPTFLITQNGLYSSTIKSAFKHRGRIASGNLENRIGRCISNRPQTKFLQQNVNNLGQKSGSPFGFGAPPRNSFI
tara:strand:+ start:4706 stop:5023 length:318 start_codon:yes stop_codon:yes gene_type:complete